MRKEQFLILLGGFALVFILFFFGKIKETGDSTSGPESTQLDFSDYEGLQLSVVPEDDASRIRQLKSRLNTNPDFSNNLAMSKAWEEIGNYPLGAFYYHESAVLNSDSATWESVGDKFMQSFTNYSDSLISNNLITFAVASYEKAWESDKDNLELQMKLAETYVESPEPMNGIVMLREIADRSPDFTPALMKLGRLSLQTGQYERALNRFQQVLKTDPVNTEALYFLALANDGMGNPGEAVRLLELCKQLMDNPDFTKEIDVYIDELKERSQ